VARRRRGEVANRTTPKPASIPTTWTHIRSGGYQTQRVLAAGPVPLQQGAAETRDVEKLRVQVRLFCSTGRTCVRCQMTEALE